MKIKTRSTEFGIVNHFLMVHGIEYACAHNVHAQVVTDRQMRCSFRNLLIFFFGFIALCGIFNNIEIAHNREIASVCSYLAISSFVFFALRTSFKFWSFVNIYQHGDIGIAVAEILRANREFKKSFGKRPEKLGTVGVAIKLTAVAKRVLSFKAKEQSERECYEREKLKKMYDTAQALMPVPRYKDIYAAADAGQEKPVCFPSIN